MGGWRGILGFDYGIVQAPLGPDISGPELVAAVANAGGLGLLRAPDWESPEYLRGLIRKTRTLTDKPFGIGLVLAFPHEENLRVILDEKVAVLQVYWGECTKELVLEAHQAGVKIVPQVGSIEEAKKAISVGVDAIIVQGREAGGHVIGQDALISLVPRVVDLVGGQGIPVIAAGGIVDGRGYVAALALGAQGVCLGTRFLATDESNAHPTYKRKLLELEETEYTDVFGRARWPGAPQRVLKTPFFAQLTTLPSDEDETNQPIIGHSTIHDMEKDIRRLAGTVPNATATGDIESMAMYAGQGVGLIKEILPAHEVVTTLVAEAQFLIRIVWAENAREQLGLAQQYLGRDPLDPGELNATVLQRSIGQTSGAQAQQMTTPLTTMPPRESRIKVWLKKIFCQNVALMDSQRKLKKRMVMQDRRAEDHDAKLDYMMRVQRGENPEPYVPREWPELEVSDDFAGEEEAGDDFDDDEIEEDE